MHGETVKLKDVEFHR